MAFNICDFCNVTEKAIILGLNSPEGFTFLPRNFMTATNSNDLLHESSLLTIRSLFRQNNIPETKLEQQGQKIPCIQENEFSLVLPAMFISWLLLSENPHLLAIAINIISNYATDYFKGIPGRSKVVFDIILEDKGKKASKKIHYEGEVEGLKEITKIIRKVLDDDKAC